MGRPRKSILAVGFLLLLASAPWALIKFGGNQTGIAVAAVSLILAGIVYLFVDLLQGKTISSLLSQIVHEKTTNRSFSLLRIAYLVFVYAALISAILGVLAWAK